VNEILELFVFPEKFHLLVYTGLLFLASQVGGRLATALNAPRMIGYLVIGIVLGPSVLGVFPEKIVQEDLEIITEISLAIIAFSIGGSLKLESMKRMKGVILWITILQTLMAFLVVFTLMSLLLPKVVPEADVTGGYLHGYLPIALAIGALSAATAPAAVMSIVREYRASGSFTTVLLGVIALDDALTLVIFAFAVSVGQMLMGSGTPTLAAGFLGPLGDVAVQLILGALMGVLTGRLILYFPARGALLGITAGGIFLTSGLTISLGLSPLLATMVLGFVIMNFGDSGRREKVFQVLEDIEVPIFGVFFALAGAHLQIGAVVKTGWLVMILTLGRFAGKMIGTYAGAAATSAPDAVRRYLGMALLPAAGVTVGLMLEVNGLYSHAHPRLCETMVSAVVGAVLINELLTPFFVRYALFRSGDARKNKLNGEFPSSDGGKA
jgi:Kef-type K+ transport system membrane component KefB